MAFTMSYGLIPSPTPTETAPKVIAPTKPSPHRGRKHGSLQTQAQALFDPTLAQMSEAPSPPAAMDVSEGGAALLAPSEKDAARQSTDGLSPA